MIAAKAKARESERKRGYNDGAGQRGKTSSRPTKSVRRKLAEIANVAEETIHKAKAIAARASEPVKAALRAGTTTINRERLIAAISGGAVRTSTIQTQRFLFSPSQT